MSEVYFILLTVNTLEESVKLWDVWLQSDIQWVSLRALVIFWTDISGMNLTVKRAVALIMMQFFLLVLWFLLWWVGSVWLQWNEHQISTVHTTSALSNDRPVTYFLNWTSVTTVRNWTVLLQHYTKRLEEYRPRSDSSRSTNPNLWALYSMVEWRREEDEIEIEYSQRLDSYLIEKARGQLLLNKVMTGAWIV